MQVAANHTTALVWGYETVASYGDVEVALAWIEDPQPLPSAFANITVAAGWNLASIPLATNLSNQELPGALDRAEASVVWTRVMAWDGATQRWLQHNKGWPSWMNTLTSLNHSVGFWLYVTTVGDGQLCVGGAGYAVPTSTSIYLYVGWNLVGFPHDYSALVDWSAGLTASDFTGGVVDADVDGATVLIIATYWDPATQWYQSYVESPTFPGIVARDWSWDLYVNSNNPGVGCWLWVASACVLDFDVDANY